ncbi:MAG: hypothetical protein ACW967_01285 [Candidatus Hodarchaeales archaeon]
MDSNSVSIIGGNLSGLATAIKLTEKSNPVPCEIFEAKSEAWDKPCGGGFGIAWGDMLRNKYSLKIPLKRCNAIIIGSKFNYIELPAPLYVSSRKQMQNELLHYLESSDTVKIHLNRRMNFTKDWSKFSNLNVVATGINGFSKQALNKSFRELGIFKYSVIDSPNESFSATIFYMIPEIKGYAWLFPAPNGKIDIGIGSLINSINLDKELNKFFLWVNRKFDLSVKPNQSLISWGIPIPLKKPGKIARKLKNKTFVGVGDAIELADPATAAGIEPAWYSGEILSKHIKSPNEIDIKGYYNELVDFLIKNNYASSGQQLLASMIRNAKIFHLIFSFLPNFLIKQIVKDPILNS